MCVCVCVCEGVISNFRFQPFPFQCSLSIPLKTSENQRFRDVFRGVKREHRLIIETKFEDLKNTAFTGRQAPDERQHVVEFSLIC